MEASQINTLQINELVNICDWERIYSWVEYPNRKMAIKNKVEGSKIKLE
jgi:hypothetical protein